MPTKLPQSVLDRMARENAQKTKSGKILPKAPPTNEAERYRTVYHDDLKLQLSKSSVNANTALMKERSLSNLEYVYNLNSPDVLSSQDLSSSVLDFGNLGEVENILIERARVFFNKAYIQPIKELERESLKERMKANPAIKNKQDVLDFYNDTNSNIGGVSTVELYQAIFDRYTDFASQTKAVQLETLPKFQADLSSVFNEMQSLINQGLEETDRFWVLMNTANGSILNYFKDNKKLFNTSDLKQFERAGKTLNEALEKINLMRKFEILKNTPGSNIKEVRIISSGSTDTSGFEEFKKDYKNKMKTAAEAYFEKRLDEKKTELEGKESLKNLMTILMKTAGEKADITVEIILKDGTVVTEKIDAKFGKKDRYSRTAKITGSLEKYLNNASTNIGSVAFKEYLQLIAAKIMIDSMYNEEVKLSEVRKQLKSFATYLALSTTDFSTQFFLQDYDKASTLVVVKDTYMWLSQFLMAVDNFYFVKRIPQYTMPGGSKRDLSSASVGGLPESLISSIQKRILSRSDKPKFSNLSAAVKDPEFLELIEQTINDVKTMEISFNVNIFDILS